MRLTVDHIKQFQALYQKRFGKEIGEKEAQEMGLKLVHLMARIYRPMTKQEFDVVRKRQVELIEKYGNDTAAFSSVPQTPAPTP
jgi:hypothetical protein